MTELTDESVKALLDGATPGPWMVGGVRCKIDRHDSHSILRYDADKKRDETIANVWYDPKTGLGRADAHLIAAAPDLAEALDNLLDAILAEDQRGDRALTIQGSTAALKWLLEAEDDAKAALAKANPHPGSSMGRG